MMEPLAALMILVACSQDFTVCREVPSDTKTYSSEAFCNAAMDLRMRTISRASLGLRDPHVLAQCVPMTTADKAETRLAWGVTGRGELIAMPAH